MSSRAVAHCSIMRTDANPNWSTPDWLFRELDAVFHFSLDVCAEPQTAKCRNYFTRDDNALAKPWAGVCWMNPPYGMRELPKWMRKAYEESQKGATVVCLVPSRTDAGWWHDFALKGEIWFIRGRLQFGAAKNNAPFPSAIVVFRPVSAAHE